MGPKTRRPSAARLRGRHLSLGGSVRSAREVAESDAGGKSRSGVVGPKCFTMEAYARVPGRTASRASRSASMRGRECGGEERMLATVDLPVAMEPVRPIRSMASREGRGLMEVNEGGMKLIMNRMAEAENPSWRGDEMSARKWEKVGVGRQGYGIMY